MRRCGALPARSTAGAGRSRCRGGRSTPEHGRRRAAVRAALKRAANAIRVVAEAQRPREWRVSPTPGVTVSQRVLPLDRVGCYVPGGRYPLPSSLLMTAIPARVAGVPRWSSAARRWIRPVLAAAVEAGVDRVFRLGGAHAVAAMAYGTATVPRVSKIVGPGQPLGVGGQGAGRARLPDRLLRRADRDPDRRRAGPARRGLRPISSPRPSTTPTPGRCSSRRTARWPARGRGSGAAAAGARDRRPRRCGITAASSSRDRWPRPRRWPTTPPPSTWWWTPRPGPARSAMPARCSSGSWTAQVAGDYALGSNHTLPTAGVARVRGGLHAADFVKLVSMQRATAGGPAAGLPTPMTTLARAEGLEAHARSIEVRVPPAPAPLRRRPAARKARVR